MVLRARFALLVAPFAIAVPTASAVEGAPLPVREGVVVSWQARTSVAVVVTTDQKVYAIHALRRVAPGRRVRVDGIKWGTPSAGVQWSAPGRGIKWGIRKAANGTFESGLTPLSGRPTTMSLRGSVARRFGKRGVVVAVPGATVAVPFRGAVWLPGGKRANAASLGDFGAAITVRIRFDRKGRLFGVRVVETAPASTKTPVPIAGRVIAADPAGRTITIQAGTAAFPVPVTIAVGGNVDLGLFPVGSDIAATVTPPTNPGGPATASSLSLNGSFGQADTAATNVVIPAGVAGEGSAAPGATPPAQVTPPAPGVTPPGGNPPPVSAIQARRLAKIAEIREGWAAARAAGQIPGTGLFTSQRNRLDRVAAQIAAGDLATATAELELFEKAVKCGPSDRIAKPVRESMLAASAELRGLLDPTLS